jgi:signal transduction histidine kinase
MDENLKILIIEDDEVDETIINRAFTNLPTHIEILKVITNNAINALEETFYDCVFLDNCLLDAQGYSLLKKIRSLENSVPIIVLIQDGEQKNAKELIKAGATDYVSKSILSAEILELVIRKAIEICQTQAQLAVANQKLQQNKQLLLSKSQKIEQQKQQIDLQNLKLIEALRLKSQFLATISHELRTPMNAIIGFCQLLLRPKFGILSHQQRDMLERILNNGKNLLILINEVLEFSKLQAGKLDLQTEIFDLSKLVNVTVGEMRSLAEAKKLSLKVEIGLENPTLYNDWLRLQQILIKLLSNAIKFTETGSIEVRIKELSGNYIQLEVEDTGIGIAAENIEHIFEPFRQLDQGTNRKFGGTGLGLPIVHALVSMMGGKIVVESKLGKGSLFRIELPRQVSSVLDRGITEASYDGSYKKVVNNNKQEDYQAQLQSKKQQG